MTTPNRIDAFRYSWETWTEDDTTIVGLLDHHGNDDRPMMVTASKRDARILLAVIRSLEVTTNGGLPFNPIAARKG